MECPKYIVKVIGNDCSGTGIIIDNDLILTAEHLMNQKEHKIELYNGNIISASKYKIEDNGAIGLLKLEAPIHEDIKHLLTAEYIPYQNDEWEIYGYITNEQINHYMKGKGTHYIIDEENEVDIQLTNCIIGEVDNYKGMSGSPVIVDGMIIGIVQEQIISGNKATGIKVSSISSFQKYIDKKYIEENKINTYFKENMYLFTEQQIQKNIKSGKYIPEIFIEQRDYKEYMRYFADPKLFINKAIDEISAIDFKDINKFLYKKFKKKIEFRIPSNIEIEEDLIKSVEVLIEDMENATQLVKEKKQLQNLIKKGLDVYYREIKDYYNRALQFNLGDITRNLQYIKYKYVIITNKAGQGKTNFICDFTKNFLLKKNFFVLYINAYEVNKDLYEFIFEKLINFLPNKDINYIYNIMETEYRKNYRPFIIVIDGLNENNQFNSFSNVIRQFLERIVGYSFIKVIMTTRDEFYDEKFKAIDTGIYSEYFNRMKMFNNNEDFKDRIFRGYLNFYNITIRNYSLNRNIFDRLSMDTLLLRFFCEANKCKKQLYMYDIYKYNTFEKYTEKKIEEYNNIRFGLGEIYKNVLDKIIEYMLEHKQYFHIPVDIMDKEEIDFIYELILNDVILKDDIVSQEGFLKEKKTVISFTFDEFRDFCIVRYIAKKYDENQIKEFINDLDKDYNTSIKEGILRYLFFIGRTSNDDVIDILKSNNFYNEIYWQNIFELSDEYINDEDIEKIENEFLCETKNIGRIILDLIFRYDIDYFKKLNINNLFHIMNVLCENDYGKYEKLIREKFEPDYTDSHYFYGSKCIWAYNEMLDRFNILLKQKNRKIYKEFFKITIYLMDVISWDTYGFWENYIKYAPNIAVQTLKNMNNKIPAEINENIKAITQHLLNCEIEMNKETKENIQKINEENNTVIERNPILDDMFLKLIGKEDILDEDN